MSSCGTEDEGARLARVAILGHNDRRSRGVSTLLHTGILLAPTPPTVEPQEFVAGDTVQWTKAVPDYPATDGWTLKYAIKGYGVSLAVTATASGPGYSVTVLATATASLKAGVCRLLGWVENSDASERHAIVNRSLTIRANVAVAVFSDLQSQAEKELSVVEAACLGRLTSDLQSYQIAGTAVSKIPIRELYRIRGMLRASVWREQNPGRMGPSIATAYSTPGGSNSAIADADIADPSTWFIGSQT